MVRTATALADQDQRKTLKFGFSAKGGSSKVLTVRLPIISAMFALFINFLIFQIRAKRY